MRLFWWPALVLALVYTAVAASLLLRISGNADGEEITATWLVIGAPWIWSGILGTYYWMSVPLNGLTIYFLALTIFSAYRALRAK